MKRLIYLFLICPAFLTAQLKVQSALVDFGHIASFNNDTAYFEFSNTGNKTIFLLPVLPHDDYAVLCSSKTIPAGESIRIGIVYYTDKKGKFEIQIPLYFSHTGKPIEITIKGNIKSIRETAFNKCPSIENSQPLKAAQIPLNIVLKDKDSKATIRNGSVEVFKGNLRYATAPDYSRSYFKSNVDYGRLQITAYHPDYLSADIVFEYSEDKYNCLIYLEKKEALDTVKQKENIISRNEIEPIVDSLPPTPVYIPVAYADSGFNSYRYKPNQLIFIIDISGSMQDSSKLYYLKQSMKALISIIRPGDYVTLITYTNKVKVVFEHVSGLDKKSIETAIDTLQAGGGSNGAASISLAYEIAKKHLIPNGNNQIFLATDGLLNSSRISNTDLYKIAAKAYRQDQIILSSIGFGKDANALDFLMKLAKYGRGNFIQILNLSTDIQNLTEEVKMQSKI